MTKSGVLTFWKEEPFQAVAIEAVTRLVSTGKPQDEPVYSETRCRMTLASTSFKTEFAVDMTCQSCVNAVTASLQEVEGIERYDIDLEKKRVTITGKSKSSAQHQWRTSLTAIAPPSQLLAALKSTERQVIVRGSSSASPGLSSSAAVSILESPIPLPHHLARTANPILAGLPETTTLPTAKSLPGMNEEEFSQKVFGICRFVQIAPRTILMDLTVRLPPPANVGLPPQARSFDVYIASTGNMVDPPRTTGAPFLRLGSITPDKEGYGDLFKEVDGELWEWIGRGCVVQAKDKSESNGSDGSAGRIFAGVVARSAGAWGNDKTVCACSGRTMWEEGRDMEKITA